ncbi:hypothetical protein J5N97_028568 [Dioscorea zingiberensis]|uniref:Uncharacterized protein n=1 Tax=Dioscorea zingiberensis TaxID=325984 RepID=A0A9D5BZA5_9LILI|nr:hypothetical protein J5N97_028568 [Dioscorea zingiberensis]
MSEQQQLMRPETEAGKEEKGRSMQELPLQSSPYVKYSDMEIYKLHDYDNDDHLPTIKTTRCGGSPAGSPTLSRSATNSPTLARSCSSKDRFPSHSPNNSNK